MENQILMFTSLYKNITNDLAILRVLVAQRIERPPGVRKVVGSNPATGSEYFLSIIGLKKEVSIYFFKPLPKVVIDHIPQVLHFCYDYITLHLGLLPNLHYWP